MIANFRYKILRVISLEFLLDQAQQKVCVAISSKYGILFSFSRKEVKL